MKGLQEVVPSLLFATVVVVLWQLAVVTFKLPPAVFPGPEAVFDAFVSGFPVFLRNAQVTLLEVILGLIAAIASGTLLGTAIAFSRAFGRAIYPGLIAAQVMPKVAIAPLLIVWFGFGQVPVIIMTALIAFFPVVINTIVGFQTVPEKNLRMFRAFGASRPQVFVKLLLPNGLPVLFAGAKVASTLAVIGAVVGEFAGAQSGLGNLLMTQVGQIQTAAAFATIICLTAMGLGVFGLIVLLERIFVPAHMCRSINGSS